MPITTADVVFSSVPGAAYHPDNVSPKHAAMLRLVVPRYFEYVGFDHEYDDGTTDINGWGRAVYRGVDPAVVAYLFITQSGLWVYNDEKMGGTHAVDLVATEAYLWLYFADTHLEALHRRHKLRLLLDPA